MANIPPDMRAFNLKVIEDFPILSARLKSARVV